jgi:hypothetical protein
MTTLHSPFFLNRNKQQIRHRDVCLVSYGGGNTPLFPQSKNPQTCWSNYLFYNPLNVLFPSSSKKKFLWFVLLLQREHLSILSLSLPFKTCDGFSDFVFGHLNPIIYSWTYVRRPWHLKSLGFSFSSLGDDTPLFSLVWSLWVWYVSKN